MPAFMRTDTTGLPARPPAGSAIAILIDRYVRQQLFTVLMWRAVVAIRILLGMSGLPAMLDLREKGAQAGTVRNNDFAHR